MTMIMLLDHTEVGKRSMVEAMDMSGHVADGFSALFVFGDSLLDPGNGIHLDATTNSRLPIFLIDSNHPPYGRDLPSHQPSGRYSNGLVATDILGNLLS